jgi:hypothetical protein
VLMLDMVRDNGNFMPLHIFAMGLKNNAEVS